MINEGRIETTMQSSSAMTNHLEEAWGGSLTGGPWPRGPRLSWKTDPGLESLCVGRGQALPRVQPAAVFPEALQAQHPNHVDELPAEFDQKH